MYSLWASGWEYENGAKSNGNQVQIQWLGTRIVEK